MSYVGWDLDGDSNKAEFTKFPVGVTRIRILDDAPHIRWTHWLNQFNRSVNCPGPRDCPIDEIISRQRANGEKETYSRARRFAMNIYNYETGRNEIMEQSKTFMEDLKLVMQDLAEEGKRLRDVVLRVRRTGTGRQDTTYRIDIDGDATEEAQLDGVIDLVDYFKPHTPEQIRQLLAVKENHREEWDRIMQGDDEEEIEVR